jgi:hypothetical protein
MVLIYLLRFKPETNSAKLVKLLVQATVHEAITPADFAESAERGKIQNEHAQLYHTR